MVDSLFEVLAEVLSDVLSEEWPVRTDAAWARLYYNVSLIDCESKEILDELLATTALEQYGIQRLSDCCLVIDSRQKAVIQRALARRSYPFRITDLSPREPVDDRQRGPR